MANIESDLILESVKAGIGGALSYCDDTFNTELIIEINTALSILKQIGIGREDFVLTYDESWADFFGEEDDPKYMQAKSYVYLKVRQVFDPPTNSTVAKAIESRIAELEWRLHNLANY